MMSDEPPYHIEIEGIGEDTAQKPKTLKGRPWVGICFDCCGVYTRVYRNPEGSAYVGRCPRCQRTVRLRVAPDGTNARFFSAQ